MQNFDKLVNLILEGARCTGPTKNTLNNTK